MKTYLHIYALRDFLITTDLVDRKFDPIRGKIGAVDIIITGAVENR